MHKTVKEMAQRLPVVRTAYRHARDAYAWYRKRRFPTELEFTDKYSRNAWRGVESVSGTGSDLSQTLVIAAEIPTLLRELGVVSMLDVPCGDFNWMRTVDLTGIRYIGADIVKDLVRRNRTFEKENIAFTHANLLTDELPKVDLILCRDCLVHFSHADIRRALNNMRRSGATYLLTTTFPDRTENADIPTGRWRVLNLERAPFNFPPPLRLIVEQCTEGNGKYSDKSLGVWRIDDLSAHLSSP
jgi:hypothetical protein